MGDSEDKNDALRFDAGKPPMDLIPADALEELAHILGFGAKKYAPRNWERGMNWSKCHASLLRHVAAWSKGEDYDQESGCLHMGHAMWNAMVLVSYQLRGAGKDDRYKYTNKALPEGQGGSADQTEAKRSREFYTESDTYP